MTQETQDSIHNQMFPNAQRQTLHHIPTIVTSKHEDVVIQSTRILQYRGCPKSLATFDKSQCRETRTLQVEMYLAYIRNQHRIQTERTPSTILSTIDNTSKIQH